MIELDQKFLAQAKRGTRLMVTGYLDNSAKNKNNPDPTRAVRFGGPAYDEMMVSIIELHDRRLTIEPRRRQLFERPMTRGTR